MTHQQEMVFQSSKLEHILVLNILNESGRAMKVEEIEKKLPDAAAFFDVRSILEYLVSRGAVQKAYGGRRYVKAPARVGNARIR